MIKCNFINSVRYLNLLLLICLVFACQTKNEEKEIQHLPDHWVVMDVSEAISTDGFYVWDFDLKKPGKYDLQLVSAGVKTTIIPELEVRFDQEKFTESPNKIFVIDSATAPKTIFQFTKNLIVPSAGKQRLKVQTSEGIDQVRIMPRYSHRLGFGSGKYEEDWWTMHNSPDKQASLEWFKEAKYGMFIHWGIYSQAGGVWKGTRINDSPFSGPKVAEWLMYTFRISRAEYAELAKTFNPDKTFAETIAKLAKDAGMKYIVITTKHHDGFALFDSKSSEYDMVDATPYNADAIKELYVACLAEGLKFGAYYSHGNDWYNGTDGNYSNIKKKNDSLGILSHATGKNLWDPSPNTHAEYLESKAYNQVEELVKMMPELLVLWFDGEGYITEEQSFRFYKMIYDLNPSVLVNRRVGYEFGDYLDAGDNVIPSADDELTKHWETCGTTNNSWAYKSYDDDWKSTSELLYYLIDIASKGGNYLLNIGPDGKGQVPEQSAKGLREVGDWLKVNGDAIYRTTRWKVISEGGDETLLSGTGHRAAKGFRRTFSKDEFWFTSKENKVYAINLSESRGELLLKSLKKEKVNEVRLLGSEGSLSWKQIDSGLTLSMPKEVKSPIGFVLEITIENNSTI